MTGGGWKRGLVAVMAGVVLGLGGVAGAPSAQALRNGKGGETDHGGQNLYGCDRTFGRQPEGHLAKRTTPPDDGSVHPGDTIDVSLIWATGDWSAPRLHKVLDCVAVDGELVPSLQDGESPTDNDGRFDRSYTVPDGIRPGAEICDQAMLSGPSPRGDYDRQISNMVCHTVAGGSAAGPPPCRDRCGNDNHGCNDCYQKKPPAGDRCGNEASCDRAEPPCGQRDQPCGRRDHRGCDCDDRDGHGSFLHRVLRHIFH